MIEQAEAVTTAAPGSDLPVETPEQAKRRWLESEIALLVDLVCNGETTETMARRFDRSGPAVESMIRRLRGGQQAYPAGCSRTLPPVSRPERPRKQTEAAVMVSIAVAIEAMQGELKVLRRELHEFATGLKRVAGAARVRAEFDLAVAVRLGMVDAADVETWLPELWPQVETIARSLRHFRQAAQRDRWTAKGWVRDQIDGAEKEASGFRPQASGADQKEASNFWPQTSGEVCAAAAVAEGVPAAAASFAGALVEGVARKEGEVVAAAYGLRRFTLPPDDAWEERPLRDQGEGLTPAVPGARSLKPEACPQGASPEGQPQ